MGLWKRWEKFNLFDELMKETKGKGKDRDDDDDDDDEDDD